MTHRLTALLLTSFLLFLALPASVYAKAPSFTGHYVLDEAESEDVLAAFEPALKEMNVAFRAVARRRLRGDARPPEELRITHAEPIITLQSSTGMDLTGPTDGTPFNHRNEEGRMVKYTIGVDDNLFRVRKDSSRGHYIMDHRLSPDGRRLFVTMRIHFKQLPRPVAYRLVYRRN